MIAQSAIILRKNVTQRKQKKTLLHISWDMTAYFLLAKENDC